VTLTLTPTGVVAGTIYEDSNGNGTQDPGEPGIPNVSVKVTDVNGIEQILTTDTNGNYAATVPAGSAVIDIDDNTLPGGVSQTEGTDSTTITVPADGIGSDVDGFEPPADAGTVSGVVYEDTNGNGTQDAGEAGIAGVTIIITDSAGGTRTLMTDGDGEYSATVPAGATTVDIDETTIPGGSSQTEGTDVTIIDVPANGVASDVDGYQPPADAGEVSGVIYEDSNGNGAQDPGEPGIPGVLVEITDINGNTQTVITGDDGSYIATVPAGNTRLNVDETTLPGGSTQTEGTDVTIVTVPAGGAATDIDGYQPPANQGTLNGIVYEDSNGNGTQDAGEPGIGGVDVTITDSEGNIQTVVTDSNGTYSVSVPAGTTLIDIDQNDIDPTFTLSEGTDPTTVQVPASGTATDIDGYAPSLISGVVFIDNDSNGQQDPGENGVGGWTVELISNITGALITLETEANGTFTQPLLPGDYTVRIISPGGLIVQEQQTTLVPGVPVFVPQPIDPSGIIYDEETGNPVPGAQVFLTNNGVQLPAVCLGAGEQGQTTGVDGAYAFFLNPGADPVCPVADTVYEVQVIPSNGFQTSVINPPQAGVLDADTCLIDAVVGITCEVSSQSAAPINGTPIYFLQIELGDGDPAVFNNHIPLTPPSVVLPPPPPSTPVKPIPTLSEWGRIILMLLIGVITLMQQGRRRKGVVKF
jgi:hypothetical protein